MGKKIEIFDQVDESGKVIGELTRQQAHSNRNVIHPVVHCWIFNNQGQILLQQRSFQKELHPGEWDMSCGGHMKKGESNETAVNRELQEELGINDYMKPILVSKIIKSYEDQTELIYLYYSVCNLKVTDFKIQKEELEQVKWATLSEAYAMYDDRSIPMTPWVIIHLPIVLEYLLKKAINIEE